MEALPFVDEFSRAFATSPDAVWDRIFRFWRKDSKGASWFARALGADPATRRGEWMTLEQGATVPGFAVADAQRPQRLELRGHHRFASYALVFLIEGDRVRAQTYADFPGLRGRCYKALVIGTRAHRLIVQQMLRKITRA